MVLLPPRPLGTAQGVWLSAENIDGGAPIDALPPAYADGKGMEGRSDSAMRGGGRERLKFLLLTLSKGAVFLPRLLWS